MFWYGAYVTHDSTQSAIKDGVLSTIRTFEPAAAQNLEENEFVGLYQYAALKWNLLIISPLKDGCVGLWGTTPKFLHNVFQGNSYSGIILELEDEKDYKFWSYKVLDKGTITDWFVSDPPKYFDSWDVDSIRKYLRPYVADRAHQPVIQVESLDKLSPDLFTGKLDVLERNNLIKKGVFSKDIAASLSHYQTAVAFTSFLSNLEVPYNNFDFTAFNFGVYLDVQTKRIDLSQRPELIKMYDSINMVRDLNDFSFVLFDLKESDHPTLFIY